MRLHLLKPQCGGCGKLRNPKQIFEVLCICVMRVLRPLLGDRARTMPSENVLGRVCGTIYLRNMEKRAQQSQNHNSEDVASCATPNKIFSPLHVCSACFQTIAGRQAEHHAVGKRFGARVWGDLFT